MVYSTCHNIVVTNIQNKLISVTQIKDGCQIKSTI